jgi:5'-deoxynucleotidase YfbR-like HD superfamily hydrolase
MNLVEDPRAAGEVRRYHTWRVIKEQTVGLHTWQILRILLTVWPNAPRHVIVHGLIHDMGEMSGDIQYPFKNLFSELRTGSEKAENYVRDQQQKTLGAPEVRHPLSPFEHQVFKACDNLEMWEFGMNEVNMGNLYAGIVVTRMRDAVANNIANLEGMRETHQFKQNDAILVNIHRYINTRLKMEDFSGYK